MGLVQERACVHAQAHRDTHERAQRQLTLAEFELTQELARDPELTRELCLCHALAFADSTQALADTRAGAAAAAALHNTALIMRNSSTTAFPIWL